jgi:hypothetical protein
MGYLYEENYLCCFVFLLGLGIGFLYHSKYPTRPFTLHIYKENERMGKREKGY